MQEVVARLRGLGIIWPVEEVKISSEASLGERANQLAVARQDCPTPESVADLELRNMGVLLFFAGYLGAGCSITELIIRGMLPASWWAVSAQVPTCGWAAILGVSLVVVVSSLAVVASRSWGRRLLLFTTVMGMIASSVLGVGLMLVLAFLVLFQLLPRLRTRLHHSRQRTLARRPRKRRVVYYTDLSVNVLWTCAVLLGAWMGLVVLGCKNVQP